MKIINLIEDTKGNCGCKYEHGLSFYIETETHKLLFDTGATGAFLENAKILGVDLMLVDTVILSHGHYDHAGGILDFVILNPKATIYMQNAVIGEYYNLRDAKEKYIGIDKRILELPQVCFLNGDYQIDQELALFTNVLGRKYWSKSNFHLKKKTKEGYLQDEFLHEQNLVITEQGVSVLLSGCAHNGILNILESYRERFGGVPDKVISGFHMMKQVFYDEEEIQIIENTAKELKKWNTIFYTGHCTGEEAFEKMKAIMGEQLMFVHSGESVL